MAALQAGHNIEPLGEHERAAFSCGIDSLDRYLKEHATQDVRRHAAAVFVLCTAEKQIAGYYTLSATSIKCDDLPKELLKKIKWKVPPYKELPATLLGRLAIATSFQRQGWGELLLIDAMKRTFQSTASIATSALVVDAKDKTAEAWYERYGFHSFPDTESRLFLPMPSIAKLFQAPAAE